MRTEMVIRMQTSSEKGPSKAMKVAAAIDGVESVTLAGHGRNLLRVVGDGVDSNHLTSRLRRKVGHADIVELRTLQDRGYKAGAGGSYYYSSQAAARDGARGLYNNYPAAASYSPAAPYYHQPYGYYPAPYDTSVVHHEYPTSDPNSCSIM